MIKPKDVKNLLEAVLEVESGKRRRVDLEMGNYTLLVYKLNQTVPIRVDFKAILK